MALRMRSQDPIAVKICGITNLNQAKAIAALGVDAIGVIGVNDSPRFVNEEQRRKLLHEHSKFAPKINRVWVVADMEQSKINTGLQGEGIPSVIQLHGNETAEECANLRKENPTIKCWKALRLRNAPDLELTSSYFGKVDALPLDTWSPEKLGGTGNPIPLHWIKENPPKLPWWLAGGISAESISEILGEITPWGIDASSRLEKSPGIKDLEKVEALLKVIREHNNTN